MENLNINYNHCLTNLANSIRLYYGLEIKHNTIEEVDKELKKDYKNVVIMLFDGMGSKILEDSIEEDSFFRSNKVTDLYSVYPPTTVAATTSIRTGLNPIETGYIGWNTYIKDIDDIVTTFFKTTKKDKQNNEEINKFYEKYLSYKTIVEELNEKGIESYEIFPFSENHKNVIEYSNINEGLNKLRNLLKKDTKKFIYFYDTEPDSTLHENGLNKKTIELIKLRNKLIKNLAKDMKDTLLIIIADHGHINVENILIDNYPDFKEQITKELSIEPRTTNFFVKDKEKFKELFNKYFKDDFILLEKDEVLKNNLFGEGIENPIFKDLIGDFVSLAKTNKTFIDIYDMPLVSHHAGLTDREMYVPLIMVKKK